MVELPPMRRFEHRALTDEEIAHFDLVAPSTAGRARLLVVPFLSPGAAGMTLGRWVLLKDGHQRRDDLVAHELVHVEQWHDLRPLRFLTRYLRSYAQLRFGGLAHQAAYLAIPFEREARERTAAWLAQRSG